VIPAILTGPAVGAALVLAGVAWLHLVHNPGVRARHAAEIAAATAAAMAEHQAAALGAVEAATAAAQARDAERTVIRERIIRVPVTTACADSPAVAAALYGLRGRPAGAGAPAGAAVPAGLPAPAGPARQP
jgi:hypothetical protein